MRRILIGALVLILVPAVVVFALQYAENKFTATVGQDGIQHVEITGGSYYFAPNLIVVKVNVPVELSVKQAGGGDHDIACREAAAGIDFKEELGKTPKIVKFTPTKVGRYEFGCTKKPPFGKSHKERGMYGYFEVVE